jgi:hypothetical protein
MRAVRLCTAILSGIVAASCDSSGPTEPTLDADLSVVEVMTGGITAYSTAGTGFIYGGGYAPTVKAMYPSACAYDAATQYFVCPTVTAYGLTTTRKFRLFDASGAALSTTTAAPVASMHVLVDIGGITTTSVQITRHEELRLSGIQSVNRVLNGTTTQQVTRVIGTQSILTNDTTVTTDLQLLNSLTQKYPLGGTITSRGTRDYGDGPRAYHREVSFDGSSVVTIRFFEDDFTITCRFDLAITSGSSGSCS